MSSCLQDKSHQYLCIMWASFQPVCEFAYPDNFIDKQVCILFKFVISYSVIIRVRVVLKRTVVGD